MLRRNPETAAEIERILHLPVGAWSDLQIECVLDELATARVTFLLTADQFAALAQLAAGRPP
jgi:hypothetical protein